MYYRERQGRRRRSKYIKTQVDSRSPSKEEEEEEEVEINPANFVVGATKKKISSTNPTHTVISSLKNEKNDSAGYNRPPQKISFADTKYNMGYIGSLSSPKYTKSYSEEMSSHGQSAIIEEFFKMNKVFELPPLALRDSLIDLCFTKALLWMPIFSKAEFEKTPISKKSVLLLQAMFVAGSQMRREPHPYASTGDFYQRCKALMFYNFENDAVVIVQSLCLMQWWLPNRPHDISLDTSWHWNNAAITILIQLGFHNKSSYKDWTDKSERRRLWWTVLARDCILAASYGRPRQLKRDDSDVEPPSIDDFDIPDINALAFIEFVKIMDILADISEHKNRRQVDDQYKQDTCAKLKSWINSLPECLKLYDSLGNRNLFHFAVIQLHIIYFTAVSFLHIIRVNAHNAPIAYTPAMVASSFVAKLMDEMIAREEVDILPPYFNWMSMIAVIPQVFLLRKNVMVESCKEEIEVFRTVVAKRVGKWKSAKYTEDNMTRMINTLQEAPPCDEYLAELDKQRSDVSTCCFSDMQLLFPFPDDACSKMQLLQVLPDNSNQFLEQALSFTAEFDFGFGMAELPWVEI